jgi:hypothetical protein
MTRQHGVRDLLSRNMKICSVYAPPVKHAIVMYLENVEIKACDRHVSRECGD